MAHAVKIRSPFEVLGLLNTTGIPLGDIAVEFGCTIRYVREIIRELVDMGHDLHVFTNPATHEPECRILKSGWHRARLAAEAYYERTYGR